jgi:signal transduction histidine kinase
VVAHAMSVIAVQAGTGRFVIDDSPDIARDVLATIETTSRSALQEMRRLLSVLRDDDSAVSELLPTPGLHALDGLIAATTDAGINVDVRTRGVPVPLPSGVDLCAYRVIQEALTNVRKHARASRATVTVVYEPTSLTVEVTDDGIGSDASPPPDKASSACASGRTLRRCARNRFEPRRGLPGGRPTTLGADQ